MRITDLLKKESIDLEGSSGSKPETIRKMADLMEKSGNISDKEEYVKGLEKREEESTTAVGEGIAIPHYKGNAVRSAGLAAMVFKDGTDFDSIDGEPVHLIFAIAAPDTKENVHLDVLSKLSVLLMDEEFSQNLINAKTADEFIAVIDKAETEKDGEENVVINSGAKLLVVTGCPTGIAHTYMAAEGLQKAAEKANCRIKVETRGSGGAKNILTDAEIAEADCIIVAADTKVPMERFNGKKVIVTQVSDGISKADELVAKAVKGEVPIFAAAGHDETEKKSDKEKKGVGHAIYTHLMSGVSHMLPFVIGGGILIAIAFLLDDFKINPDNFGMNTPIAAFFKTVGGVAFGLMLPVLAGYIAYSIADRPGLAVGFVGGMLASTGNSIAEFANTYSGGVQGFLANTVFNPSGNTVSGFLGALLAGFAAGCIVLLLKKLFSKLPESLEGIKPMLLYPVLGIFIMGMVMLFIFNPIIGMVNEGLSNLLTSMGSSSRILLGIVLGGMMAIDMGGPINKAAYVFGTMAIANGNYDMMASVMIGGMVPPIGIALATTFFKNRFTKAERHSGITNYVMGLAFITEGAIPFAAADPLHVIPATAIGAAVAGALSMAFGCTLMAPHGGVFVFPVVGNWIMYLVSLAAGSVVTMLLLALFKKPVNDNE